MHLIERLIEKEEDALTEVMDIYGDYLLRTAFLLTKDYQTAEEAVQDTFVTAFKKIQQLDDPDKFKSWLTTIVINRCRSQMRKWTWKNILPHFGTGEQMDADDSPGPEEALLSLEKNGQLFSAIQQLDYTYREVITLFYFNEWKIKDIAAYAKTNENTIKSRLTRGRRQLKNILSKGEKDDEQTTAYTEKSTR